MVTRILFDPRRDLPNGSTQSNPVIIEATPTGIREDGQVVIYSSTITFTITTGADVFQLPANTASNGWRLTIRDTITSAVKQQRTVRVPDQASILYQSLPDIDPASFTVTPGTARQWDATFWTLVQAIGTLPTDATVTAKVNAAVTALVGTASTALDTLGEIQTALGSDPNLATTLTTAIATKSAALNPTTVKTTAYTAGVSDFVPVDATAAAVTVTLPAAPADRTRVGVKKLDTSSNTVTIARGGLTDVFNKTGGSTSLSLTLTNQSVTVQYQAATGIWYVVDSDLPYSQVVAAQAVLNAATYLTFDGTNLRLDGQIVTVGGGSAPTLSNTVSPAISGTAQTGSTLTVSNGTWSATPDSYTYQWKRGGTAITGATAQTYTLVTGDVGQTITCTVTPVKAGYTSSPVTSGSVTPSTPATALSSWTTAVANRGTTPAKWMAIGDSTSEGQGASVLARRWQDHVQAAIRAQYSLTGGAGFKPPFYDTYNGTPATEWYTATSGTIANSPLYGNLGYRTAQMSTGASRTYTFTGTDLDIWYAKNGGTFTWAIDGGSTTPVDTSGTYTTANRVPVRGLTAGSHTVTIAATTGPVYFGGLTIYSGDLAAGVQQYDSGHSGATIATFTADQAPFVGTLNLVAPDLVTLQLGLNDAASLTPSAFQTSLTNFVTTLQSLTKKPSILIIANYQPASTWTGSMLGTWSAYVAAMQAVATAKTTAFLDLSAVLPTADTTGTGNYASDGLHPNDTGYAIISRYIAPAIGITPKLVPTSVATMTGTAQVGQVLTATNGAWNASPDSHTYQWLRAGAPISGATAQTYTLVTADIGQAVNVVVTGLKSGYSNGTSTSAAVTPTAAPATGPGDTFTGTNGAGWDASKWTTKAGTATIQSNAGQLVTPSGGYSPARADYTGMTAQGDTDMVVSVTAASSGVEQYSIISIDGDGSGTSWAPGAGLTVWLDYQQGQVQIHNGASPSSVVFGAMALSGGTKYKVRLQSTGTTVRVKVWDAAGSEPGTWLTTTTVTPLTGKVSLGAANGSDGTARTFTYDDLTIA